MTEAKGPSATEEGFRRLRRLLQRAVRQLGLLERHEVSCCGITLAQCHALQEVVASPGLSVADLAARLGVDASTASRAADALVRMGAAQRAPVPGNRRAVTITPTPRGRSLLATLDAQADAHAQRLWSALPGERREAVVEAVNLLLEVLGRLGLGGCCPSDKRSASIGDGVERGES